MGEGIGMDSVPTTYYSAQKEIWKILLERSGTTYFYGDVLHEGDIYNVPFIKTFWWGLYTLATGSSRRLNTTTKNRFI